MPEQESPKEDGHEKVAKLTDKSPPIELAESLLREADIHDVPESLALLGASTSNVWLLTVGSRQYILRQRFDQDVQMALKEMYLSDLLRRNGIPAPEVLALVTVEQGVGTLSTWLEGVQLDQAMTLLSVSDLHSAWYSIGKALRLAHEIVLPEAGEIVGDGIESFSGGWAQWILSDIPNDLDWLQRALGSPAVKPSRVDRVVAAAIDVLKNAPIRLLHNDALPQNVLVASAADGWRCTGWLDWEFARAGDPLWDIATLDFRPAKLVPPIFYEGYGLQPAEPQMTIYELLTTVWRTRAELEHGSHWNWPPHAARVAYLRTLADQINRLSDLLGTQ